MKSFPDSSYLGTHFGQILNCQHYRFEWLLFSFLWVCFLSLFHVYSVLFLPTCLQLLLPFCVELLVGCVWLRHGRCPPTQPLYLLWFSACPSEQEPCTWLGFVNHDNWIYRHLETRTQVLFKALPSSLTGLFVSLSLPLKYRKCLWRDVYLGSSFSINEVGFLNMFIVLL